MYIEIYYSTPIVCTVNWQKTAKKHIKINILIGGDKMKGTRLSILLLFLLISSMVAIADPIGPENVTIEKSDQLVTTSWVPYNISAIAGNITELVISSWTLTRTWAGFYGNITGTIVLADANNNTMYDWYDADPSGKVYASIDNTVTWPNIACTTLATLSGQEAEFSGTNETDRDGKYPVDAPNRTFIDPDETYVDVLAESANFSDYPLIYVGSTQINPSECPSTSLHNENGSYVDYVKDTQNAGNDPLHFRELVLEDTTGSTVYTTILEKDYLGFDGRTHDFELIVPEDGHGTDTDVTYYYFYVELE
ncbi:hypothetical protein C0585_00005 [Candidatus Woesearchaeota archaeon]|nr:MAG: hypothetical protein C0585_00005 [Candidatus Woesearchaeota archaeon]